MQCSDFCLKFICELRVASSQTSEKVRLKLLVSLAEHRANEIEPVGELVLDGFTRE
jgi:hypothetical protein